MNIMPDEFTKVATNEIIDELKANSRILKSCKTDQDIVKNGSEIGKHLHKIKGLAPMVGFNSIGELASINDLLIKKLLDGEKIKGIFETINQSNNLMNDIIRNPSIDIDEIKQAIKIKYSAFLV
jgi:chemotaxis protein histidine kinase CheA